VEDAQKDQHNAHVATIAAAYLGNPSNPVERGELADVIRQIGLALKGSAETETAPAPEVEKPSAAAVRKSITDDHLISFIDGKRYKTLARHLKKHNHTPESYRERYGLKADYPMTAPSYSAMRSNLAKERGLGQVRRSGEEPLAAPVEAGKMQTVTVKAEPVQAEAPKPARAVKAKPPVKAAKPASEAPVSPAVNVPAKRTPKAKPTAAEAAPAPAKSAALPSAAAEASASPKISAARSGKTAAAPRKAPATRGAPTKSAPAKRALSKRAPKA
jgi:predicted transcriptional regulator